MCASFCRDLSQKTPEHCPFPWMFLPECIRNFCTTVLFPGKKAFSFILTIPANRHWLSHTGKKTATMDSMLFFGSSLRSFFIGSPALTGRKNTSVLYVKNFPLWRRTMDTISLSTAWTTRKNNSSEKIFTIS